METGSGNTSGSSTDSAAKTTTSSGDGNNRQGCGCVSATKITVRVTPTTGGQFDLSIAKTETIENLKKLISKKLKVPKERICLLHRDRQLRDGTVQDNQLMEGSRLTLLPSVETGLLAQRPEQSVMQALESLNDSQVNDFLSGKAPLNLTMRLGDHMMLIQLQLSTVTPTSSRRSAPSAADPASRNHLASSLSDVISGMAKNLSAGKEVRTSAVKIASLTTTAAPKRPAAPSTTLLTDAGSSPAKVTSVGFKFPAKTPAAPSPKKTSPPVTAAPSGGDKTPAPTSSSSSSTSSTTTTTGTGACKCEPAVKPVLDTRALAEASRNLTQTLKQLSSEVLTSRTDPAEDTARSRRQGAIIESMHHHGKGVYSGTFSGTLNPALQDRFGRPKRDISTIIHILNDLLCATPQYRRHAAAAVETLPKVGAQPETMDFPEDSLLRENQATRGKLEQLRLIMEERRARRRARREARSAPYTTQWSAKSETLNSQSAGEPMETGEGGGGAGDLCEMTPPEPVVA